MPSKAQGLSLNVIIIALIVLVVLIILIAMTTGYFGKRWVPSFNKISDASCATQGKVVDKSTGCIGDDKEGTGFYDDVGENEMCCVAKSCGEQSGTCRPKVVNEIYCPLSESEIGGLGKLGCSSSEKCCK